MSQKLEMDPSLRDFLEGAGSIHFPLTLLKGFQPPLKSGFQLVNQDTPTIQSYDNMPRRDVSFPAQMRDAVQAGVLTSGCTVIVTAKSAIPCADAVRGFTESLGLTSIHYDYVSPHLGSTEVGRLSRVFAKSNPDTVLILDEYVEYGRTIRLASRLVLDALAQCNRRPSQVGVILGKWYASLTGGISSDLAFDYPRLDGRNFVDYEQVSLPELTVAMKSAGRIAAKLLTMITESSDERHKYIRNQLIAVKSYM